MGKKKKEAGHFEKIKDPPSNILKSGHLFIFETPHGFAIGQIPLGNMPSKYTKTILPSGFMYLYF